MPAESLFDRRNCDEILARIERLTPQSRAQWGKLDVARMLAHCQQPLRVAVGELELKRGLIGILFGGMAKRQLLKPEPFKRGLPTAPEFRVADQREFQKEREALVALVKRFHDGGPQGLTQKPHPFFGVLTTEEWDTLQWKHLDHHLRQFGA